MDNNYTENLSINTLPDALSKLRPFASREMIYKTVQSPHGKVIFTIDPWTQRWIIAEEPVPTLLKLADGRRQLSEIISVLESNKTYVVSANQIANMTRELREIGLLFQNQAEHRESGLPVYNTCDPVGLHLEITNLCNLKCTHCYVSAGHRLPNELTLEEIYHTIDMLPPFSGKRIAISGGEPALHKNCGDILTYCVRDCGHDVDLYSNGKNFPKALAELIIELNQQATGKVRVQMSLEGATPETNDLVRGKGAFHSLMRTLTMFRTLGLNRSVVLFSCITCNNINEIDAMIRLAEEQDVSMLVFSQWQKQGYASETPWLSIAPPIKKWVEAGEKLLTYKNPRLQVFGNFFGDISNNEQGRFDLDSALFPKQVYFFNAFPRIAPDGHIFADQLWVDLEWSLGNVRNMTLDEAFQSPKFYAQLGQMRKRMQNIEKCKKCEWRSLCEGGSAGHTYAEYGHMNKEDVFCDTRIRWFNRFVEYQVTKAFGK